MKPKEITVTVKNRYACIKSKARLIQEITDVSWSKKQIEDYYTSSAYNFIGYDITVTLTPNGKKGHGNARRGDHVAL